MTSVIFFKNDDRITGFKISGHAEAGEYGQDIVCSAISSVAIMVVNTITEVMGVEADAEEKDGYLSLSVPPNRVESVQAILQGLELHLKQLSLQYPKNMAISYRR